MERTPNRRVGSLALALCLGVCAYAVADAGGRTTSVAASRRVPPPATALSHGAHDGLGEATSGPASGSSALSRAVVDSFSSPGLFPMGVDWRPGGSIGYHVDEEMGEVYSLSADGSAAYLWSVAAESGQPLARNIGNGLCLVESHGREFLYVTDFNGNTEDPDTDRVYAFELDGNVVDSMVGCWDVEAVADRVVGICFDGQSFWLSSDARGEVVRCDTLFQELESFAHPSGSSGAIDFDPLTGYYYLTDYLTGDVFVCDSSMGLIDSFRGHETAAHVAGLALGEATRERTLWMTSYGTADPPLDPCVMIVDDVYYNETPVARSTWTSLKVMYR